MVHFVCVSRPSHNFAAGSMATYITVRNNVDECIAWLTCVLREKMVSVDSRCGFWWLIHDSPCLWNVGRNVYVLEMSDSMEDFLATTKTTTTPANVWQLADIGPNHHKTTDDCFTPLLHRIVPFSVEGKGSPHGRNGKVQRTSILLVSFYWNEGHIWI